MDKGGKKAERGTLAPAVQQFGHTASTERLVLSYLSAGSRGN